MQQGGKGLAGWLGDEGTYNGRLYPVPMLAILQKAPRLNGTAGIASSGETTVSSRSPRRRRRAEQRCRTCLLQSTARRDRHSRLRPGRCTGLRCCVSAEDCRTTRRPRPRLCCVGTWLSSSMAPRGRRL